MTLFIDTRRITPTTSKTVVCVSRCYDIRAELKARGYGWNDLHKRWEKVTDDPVEEMTKLFEAKLGTIDDYERLYITGVLDESIDFSDEQFNRIYDAIGEK